MGKYNDSKLSVYYDKRQNDFVARFPNHQDGGLALYHLVGDILKFDLEKWHAKDGVPYRLENFKEELERRGYDLSTLRFSIELKKVSEAEK